MYMLHWTILISVAACLARAGSHGGGSHHNMGVEWSPKANEVIDLTHVLSADTPVHPGGNGFNFTRISRGPWQYAAGWLEDNDFCGSDVMGTTLMAPARRAQNRWYINEIPAHRFFGPLVKVDVSMKVENDSTYNLLASDLVDWENKHGRIPDKAIVLVQTGWSKHYGNGTAYYGTDAATLLVNGQSTLRFPGISEEAASWLALNRTVYGVGIDSPGIGPSESFMSAVHLHARNIYTIVGVTNLHRAPPKGYSVAALPMSVENGTAAMVRLMAFKNARFNMDSDAAVDLTYALNNDTLMFPGRSPFQMFKVYRGDWAVGNRTSWMDVNRFCGPEHMGTHLDAPAHFIKGSWRIHQIPPHSLIGPAVRIDIDHKTDANRNAVLTVDDIRAWERENGMIPENAIVFLHSGWGKYMAAGNRTAYMGTENRETFLDENGTSLCHWPGFSGESARFLVNERTIQGIGIDTMSFDIGFTTNFVAHVDFLGARLFGLENVANLNGLPARGATVFVFHMVYAEGSGAASRVVALKDGLHLPSTAAPPTTPVSTQCAVGAGLRVSASLSALVSALLSVLCVTNFVFM